MDRRAAFGNVVRTLRLRLGYSQEALALRAGLHRTYVGSIERGERNVSLDNIWRLADALDVHPSELFRPPESALPSAETIDQFNHRPNGGDHHAYTTAPRPEVGP